MHDNKKFVIVHYVVTYNRTKNWVKSYSIGNGIIDILEQIRSPNNPVAFTGF